MMRMKPNWMNSVLPIAAIFSFRMLGLFMLIPVFSIYATALAGATPTLIGLALGSYGLSQGLLQMPMGLLSDRFGRKPVLTIGLILFVVGSVLGAVTDSIYGMVIARIIQGTGAIGSVLIALLADLTPDVQRTKAMAVVGATIGISFSLAMIISPGITNLFGLAGIFYFTALLASLGLILLHGVIPTPSKEPFHYDTETEPGLLKSVLKNKHLQRLNFGIFTQHFILTATFFAIPIILQQHIQQAHLSATWQFYLPLMFFSFIAMVPMIVIAERRHKIKSIFISSVFLIALSQAILSYTYQSWLSISLLLFIYFVAFNFLEASLPSLVSKQADAKSKGTGMGVYSTSQFLGLFAGGTASGFIFQTYGAQGIFLTNALIALAWIIVASFMKPYVYQTTLLIPYENTKQLTTADIAKLESLAGVSQVFVATDEDNLYLQIDRDKYVTGSAEETLYTP